MKLDEFDLLKVGNTIQMAGAVYQGDGYFYLVLFPEDRGRFTDTLDNFRFIREGGDVDVDAMPVRFVDMNLDDWQRFLQQTDVVETEILTRASDGKLVKAIVRKTQRVISQSVSWAVYKRDGYRCRYCGDDDTPLTVDHLVLWEEGGPSIEANLLSACRECNKTRGNTQYAAWLEHPRYRATSKKLDEATRRANRELVPTLDGIPRSVHQRTRR